MPILLLLYFSASVASAQSPGGLADSRLCTLLVDDKRSGARDSVIFESAHTDSIRAAFFGGCLALANKRPEDAADEFQRAVRSRDNDPVLHLWLGRAYGEQAGHASVFRQPFLARRARIEFERSAALAPDYIDAHNALMEYALQAPGVLGGSIDRARAEAGEIAKRDPYRGGFARIEIENHEKNVQGMEQIYRQLVGQFPDSTAPRLGLIGTLATLKRWPDAWAAVDDFEKALPRSVAARFAPGRVAAESGEQLSRGERGLREYVAHEPARGDPPLSRAHWRLGMILEREGKADEARKEYEAAVALEPNLRQARDALAKLH